jgi:hypothetical protein
MMQQTDYPKISQLGGKIVDLRRLAIPDNKNWGATNPSIGYAPRKGFAVALRSSNYVIEPNGKYVVTEGNTIKSKVYFSELDKDLKLKNLRLIDTSTVPGWSFSRGLEDPKLFYRDGSWHFTCVTMEEGVTPRARMAIAKLDTRKNCITEFTKFPGIDEARPEKNWMLPYEPSPNFDWVYGPNATIVGQNLITWMTDHSEISALRGNTNLLELEDGTYLAVTHRMFGKAGTTYMPQTFGTVDSYIRNYVHYFTHYDSQGIIIGLSSGFQFYRPGVEFAAGIVKKDRDLLISFGREDVSSHIAVMPYDIVMKSLKPVNY